jgi:2,3-bisphosphoglycerate-dependent phosphoglycerate mutase
VNLQGRGIAVICRVLEAHPPRSIVFSTHGSLLALILHEFDPRFGYDFCRSLTFPDVYELTFREQTLVSVDHTWHEGGA